MTAVIREVIGETLRGIRLRQRRTLRQISADARVSLGYLSEIERGQKEPSSELLAAICAALDIRLSDLFAEVTDVMRRQERLADRAVLVTAPIGNRLAQTTVAPNRPGPTLGGPSVNGPGPAGPGGRMRSAATAA
jgi:transcriptional regulator with XRE-family HTH domain